MKKSIRNFILLLGIGFMSSSCSHQMIKCPKFSKAKSHKTESLFHFAQSKKQTKKRTQYQTAVSDQPTPVCFIY